MASVTIHPTALVGPKAKIGAGCSIGPFAVVEDGAELGENNQLGAGTYVFGGTTLGAGNRLLRGASLGGDPQDVKYKGEPTRLVVGQGNYFGENTTVHRGSVLSGETRLGDGNYLMVNVHIGHDVRLGSHITMAPGVMIGGHAQVQDKANLGGGVAVHQWCRVGALAMVGGLSRVTQDVLPYTLMSGDNTLRGLNRVGLKRNGYTQEQVAPLKAAFMRFCRQRDSKDTVMAWLAEQQGNPLTAGWLDFLQEGGKRGFARARGGQSSTDAE